MRKPIFKRSFLIIPALLLSAGIFLAADPVEHHVPRATTPIELDGALDDLAWESAVSIDLAYEVQPGENVDPPVKTVCLVT